LIIFVLTALPPLLFVSWNPVEPPPEPPSTPLILRDQPAPPPPPFALNNVEKPTGTISVSPPLPPVELDANAPAVPPAPIVIV